MASHDDHSETPLANSEVGGGAAASEVGPGARIGRFEVVRVLGRGGEGIVLEAIDTALERAVAIKILRPERAGETTRLLREAQSIARLAHPNVVTVHEVGAHGESLYVAMEIVRGGNLRRWLERGPHRWRDVLARLLPAGRGLAAAHAVGLVHRDFKPENVLQGDDGRVLVGDFGLARAMPSDPAPGGDAEISSTGTLLGTPAYLSPEQFAGRRGDARSDQFAFCVTLYEALFGMRPFEGKTIVALAESVGEGRVRPPPAGAGVPRWLARAVMRGLEHDPDRRFPSIDALLAAITPPRRRAAWIVAAGAALAIAAVAIISVATGRNLALVPSQVRSCAAAAAAIDRVWNHDARATYRARAGDEQAGWLDGYARGWATVEGAACRTSAARERACLDDALAALGRALADPQPGWPVLPAIADCVRPLPAPIPISPQLAVGAQGFGVLDGSGEQVAVTSYGGDAQSDGVVRSAPHPIAGAWGVDDWLADGRMLVETGDGRLLLGNREIARSAGFMPRGHQISPDGEILAGGTDRVELTALDDHRTLATIAIAPAMMAWSPDSQHLAILAVDGDLHLVDRAGAGEVVIPVRRPIGTLGVRSVVWLGPRELAVTATFDATGNAGVWTLHLDEALHVAAAPALRLVPPEGLSYDLDDAEAGRLLVARFSATERIYRWRDGHADELPANFNDLHLTGLDARAGAVVLAPRDATGPLVIADLANRAQTQVAAAPVPSALRGGRIAQLRAAGAGRWSLVEIDPDGRATTGASFAWDGASPALRCSPMATDRCVIYELRDGKLRVAPLGGGSAIEIAGANGAPDVSSDGARVLVPRLDGTIVEVTLATGHAIATHQVGAAHCVAGAAGWIGAGPAYWAIIWCADRFALVRSPGGDRTEEIVQSDGWMGSAEALPDGELYYSVMDHDPRLLAFDGL